MLSANWHFMKEVTTGIRFVNIYFRFLNALVTSLEIMSCLGVLKVVLTGDHWPL